MSKTSVPVIPLLKNLCWLPITYTRNQSKLVALAYVALHTRVFQLILFIPILNVPRLAEHRLLFIHAVTYALLMPLFSWPALGIFIHIQSFKTARVLSPRSSFSRGITLCLTCIPTSPPLSPVKVLSTWYFNCLGVCLSLKPMSL